MSDKLKVNIYRSPGKHIGGEIDIDLISAPHWDTITGGVKKQLPYYSLFGYIDYSLASKLVACSGRHEYYHNSAKIWIPASSNMDTAHREGYKILCEEAGEKPQITHTHFTFQSFLPVLGCGQLSLRNILVVFQLFQFLVGHRVNSFRNNG